MSAAPAVNAPDREALITRVMDLPVATSDLLNAAYALPEIRAIEYHERNRLITEARLRREQNAMKVRQATTTARAAKPAKVSKKGGAFQWRRLRNYPDYCISENGQVIGPAGTELKLRWDKQKPHVRIAGKDKAVFWLLVEAGFQESPADARNRRARAKMDGATTNPADWKKHFNSLEEAQREEPEVYGDPNGRDA